MTASTLFPLQSPFNEGYFEVGQGHRLWYTQYGHPEGIPLLWLHGGPGSGSSPRHQLFADPSRYRLILCDQRGCGYSTPFGAIRDNDTERLLQDIVALRLHLRLGKVLLGGGSWGACLALAYAERWPLTLLGLVLRAPFLAGKNDIDRFFQPIPGADSGPWRTFSSHAPVSERAQLLRYIAGEFSIQSERMGLLARAWNRYEASLEQTGMTREPDLDVADVERLIQRYRIQAHYLSNNCFLNEADLMEAAAHFGDMPVAILQGEDDRVCHRENAVRLHKRIPGSRLRMVAGAGHSPFHPDMAAALVEALNCFAVNGDFGRW